MLEPKTRAGPGCRLQAPGCTLSVRAHLQPETCNLQPFSRLWLLLLGSSFGLGVLALFLFDPSRYHFYPLCVFHETTGLLCPGCGSLRALHQLLHGNVMAAFRFNPLLVCSLPPGACLAAICALRRVRGQPILNSPHALWPWVVAIVIIGLVFGIARNVPGSALATFQQ